MRSDRLYVYSVKLTHLSLWTCHDIASEPNVISFNDLSSIQKRSIDTYVFTYLPRVNFAGYKSRTNKIAFSSANVQTGKTEKEVNFPNNGDGKICGKKKEEKVQ